jgi:NADPH:quinone reductase-like Zn-dependent oxidoreductase
VSSEIEARKMMAAQIHSYGESSELKYEEIVRPVAMGKQLLIRVYSAGVNPVDDKIRQGAFGAGAKLASPLVLGYDVAGVVEEVGDQVTRFEEGDEVFAYLSLQRGGGYAEYAIVLEAEAALKPELLSFDEAASVPLAALTAWQALVNQGDLSDGQSVLIHGGSGGVGSFAIQIAKARGAKVYATASARNQEFMKQLGADVVIDYKSQRFEEIAKDIDVVLDPIGGETQLRSFDVLKKDGILISIVQSPDPKLAAERGVRAVQMLVKPNGDELSELAELIDLEAIRCNVTEVLPLKDAAKAHDLIHTGHTRGKIVLHVCDEGDVRK